MISPKAKRNIFRIIPFGIIWLFNGIVFGIVEYAAIGGAEAKYTWIGISFTVILFGLVSIFIVGILVGIFEIFLLNRILSNKSFTKKIIYKVLIYSSFLFIITVLLFPIAASLEMKISLFNKIVWDELLLFLTSATNYSTQLQSVFSLVMSIFYSEISENIGHGILTNFFTGKYHKPTEENRIFMFTDMKSSTTIAENLGHTKYFNLLKEYYDDLSDAIIDFSGEVYQYVGDEVVISWEYDIGIYNNNCIKCFFAMKKDLKRNQKKYLDRFGVAPSFKAGLHFGNVTTGEIGALKKEIIFTGDVLNSTSRIQGLCNEYNVDLLVSEELIKNLNLEPEYTVKWLGENELKGKTKNIDLFTVTNKENRKL